MTILRENTSLRDRKRVFRDRSDAGRQLMFSLHQYADSAALVLAIPAGGVPVGLEISAGLNLILDVVVVRKVQIPGEPEAGMGSVAPDGTLALNEDLVRALGLESSEVEAQTEKARRNVAAREQMFRSGRELRIPRNEAVILVDDGLASGYTMLAAIRYVRRRGARKVVVAVPTASMRALSLLDSEADEIHCANVRAGISFAVADAYLEWRDLTEEEALAALGSR
jgi:predicted phosphoribosyltransferase